MQREERLTLFTTAAILGARLIARTSDAFFAAKLRAAYTDFVTAFSSGVGERSSVAQSSALGREVRAIDELLEALDDIEYLRITPATPLLSARCAFMRYKLFTLQRGHSAERIQREERNGQAHAAPVRPTVQSATREKILGYVTKFPRVRVRDVVRELGTLSDRTVKRGLKELVSDGTLRRVVVENTVYYTRVV